MARRSEIRGRRVVLRHPHFDDEEAFLAFVRRNRRYHRPWVHPPADADAFAAFVGTADTERAQKFLVIVRATGEIAGVANLTEIIRGPLQGAFLGFYGSVDRAGAGLMTEAIEAVVRHAFRDLGLHRVEANVRPDNLRSRALVERCGFRMEGFSPAYLKLGGRWRDHERWAILADR